MCKRKEEDNATFLAKGLLKQIETENDNCAFWIISAIHKLKYSHPKMSMTCLFNILITQMPKAAKAYGEYKRNT